MPRLSLNPSLGLPLYRQIMDGIREMVASGAMRPGERLPSIRELAAELRINPSSAVKAYTELRDAGVIELDQGRGAFVSRAARVGEKSAEELLARELDALLTRAEARGLSLGRVQQELERLITERTRKRR